MSDSTPVASPGPDAPREEGASRGLRVFAVALAVLALAVTIGARVPRLNDAMSEKRHADGTARVLRHMALWDAVGLDATHWMMRTTGLAPADRYIVDQGYLRDADGVYYYVSFPPLYPLAPYAAFKALGIAETPLAVRVFNLLLQAIGTFALFLLAKRATAGLGARFSWIAGGFAGLLYASAPVLQWYHSNAYTTASLSTPFFILAAYLGVRAIHDDRRPRWLLPALAAALFVVAYTEWLGVTFAMVAAAYGVVRWRHRPSRAFAFVAVGTVAAAMLLMLVQYSSIAGLAAFIQGISGKYAMRSGMAETSQRSILSLRSWAYLGDSYYKGYLPFLGLIPLFAAYPLWRRRVTHPRAARAAPARAWWSTPLATALVLTAAPVLLHHLLLFSHTAIHDFDMVKTAAALGLVFGVCAASLDRSVASAGRRWLVPVALGLAAAVAVGASIAITYRRDFAAHSGAEAVGEAIRAAHVSPNEVVFFQGPFYPGSAAVYYAGRNITGYEPSYAKALIAESGADGGVLFVVTPDGEGVARIERVAKDGTIAGAAK